MRLIFISFFTVCLSLIAVDILYTKDDIEEAANRYMETLNKNKIKGGCFYYKNDTLIITKINYEKD
jgi:hypothetical protein